VHRAQLLKAALFAKYGKFLSDSSVTTDFWTAPKNTPVIGATAHFIPEDFSQLVRLFLDLKKVSKSHTGTIPHHLNLIVVK
jgi:hypothetical protein